MEKYSEDNAGFNQFWELATNSEIQGRREGRSDQVQQWCNHDSYAEMPFQQDYHHPYQPPFHSPSFQNPHYTNQPYFPENDPYFFNHPDSFPNFQFPTYDNDFTQFQNQQPVLYPQPHAQPQTEHGYYSQSHAFTDFQQEYQFLDCKPWPKADSHIFSHGAGTSWRNLDAVVEDNMEEEENAFAMADKAEAEALELAMEREKWEFGAKEEIFREVEELEQEEMEGSEESSPSLSLHTEQKLPLQSEYEMISGVTQDTSLRREKGKEGEAELYLHLAELELPFPAALNRKVQQKEEEKQGKKVAKAKLLPLPLARKEEGGKEETLEEEYFSLLFREEEEKDEQFRSELLQSALDIFNGQQQVGEEREKKLDASPIVHLLEREEVIDALTCRDLDKLVQDKQNLWQHGSSIQGKGEEEGNLQISPPSLQLRRIKGNSVKDFTRAELDFPLHDERSINDGQHPTKEEKQEEEEAAPSLLEMKAAEPLYPQITSPRHQEEEAENFITSENLPFEFKLTSNQFLLVVNELVSGGELHKKQLNLRNFCKLQPKALFGEVCKRGANGDGVLWNIKVHPP